MATGMQKTGIDVVGDVSAWGAHFCLFYETKEISSTLWSHIASRVWKPRSTACGLWPSP